MVDNNVNHRTAGDKLNGNSGTAEQVFDFYNHFTCPHCGKRYKIEDAVVVDEITNTKSAGSSIKGRTVTHHFIDTHHNVRFCHKCAKKRAKVRKCLNLFVWGIAPITIFFYWVIKAFVNGEIKGGEDFVLLIGAALIMAFLFTVIFVSIPIALISKLYFDIDVDKAAEGNALVTPFN